MADPYAHLEHADLSGLLPVPPSKGRIVPAHPLYTTSVVDPAPVAPRPSWLPTEGEIGGIVTTFGRKWERHIASPVQALARISAANHRERIAQDKAMNAPFVALQRERFAARDIYAFPTAEGHGERSEPCASAVGLSGLVTSKTKVLTGREEVEIDPLQSRVRKLRKAVQNSAHALDAAAHLSSGTMWRRLFVTLTYAEVEDWKPGHIGHFTRCLRRWFKRVARVPMRMVWVLELQKRGAVHYHCMIWIPARCLLPRPDECGWWTHGSSGIDTMPGGIKRPVSYMAKYASKVDAHQASRVPKGARMYGAAGLDGEGRRWVRWWRAPLFVRDQVGGTADIRKVPGGYMDRTSGEFIESPWKVTVLPGGRVIAWRLVPPNNEGETLQ